jgi:hypothetical protein
MERDELDLTEAPPHPSGADRWRSRAVLVSALAFVVLCAGLTLSYRRAHRDEWKRGTAAWQSFDVSSDGRTLTFHLTWIGSCTRISGVHFSSDPTAGGDLTATLETRTQTMRDGHSLFCSLGMAVGGTAHAVTLDRRVPDGTLITDGSTRDAETCGRRASQAVRAPTSAGPVTYGCTLEG